jgi:benzoyl-CoA reductase subunit D
MIVAGIDIGGKNVYVVIMKDDKILIKVRTPAGIKKDQSAEDAFKVALKNTRLTREDIKYIVSTGSGSKRANFADGAISTAAADTRGAIKLIPTARTIIDVGAEESRAIQASPNGKVLDYAVNEKCAAGTGMFVDTMARALDISVEEMAQISLKSKVSISMNAQCAVFGESEVVSLIHANTPKQDIAHAVHDAIARRIGSIARIVGLEKDVVMIGGVANNVGLVDTLKKYINMDILVPEEPEYISALGAALAAAEGVVYEQITARVVDKKIIKEGK